MCSVRGDAGRGRVTDFEGGGCELVGCRAEGVGGGGGGGGAGSCSSGPPPMRD